MDIEQSNNFSKLENIQKLLMRYFPIWEKEVLNYYPESYENFPKDWVEEIKLMSDKEKWLIDSKKSFSPLLGKSSKSSSELYDLFSDLSKHTKVNSYLPNHNELKSHEISGIKIKKQHEINSLIIFLKTLNEKESKINSFIDIGGGKGHLSRLLSEKMGVKSNCIEMNKDLIIKGMSLLSKEHDVNFIHYFLPAENVNKATKLLSSLNDQQKCMCIGLHTCGPLANTILKSSTASKISKVLNFGCCYLKLPPSQTPGISEQGKMFSIPLSKYALNLATRAHTGSTWDDFLMKKRVKYYRYGLHLFLYHELGIKNFLNVGDGKRIDYQKSFGHYALNKLKKIKKNKEFDEILLNQWFDSPWLQQKIEEMFCMNIIRWQFGRAIELWILLDRACYMEENHYEVKLEEFFDEKISPRNIGLFAEKANEQKAFPGKLEDSSSLRE